MSTDLLPFQSVEDFCITFDAAKQRIVKAFEEIADARAKVYRIIERFDMMGNSVRDYDFDNPERVITNAKREMLKSAWAEIIKRSGVRDVMVERRQRELDEMLRTGELPPLNPESVRSFLDGLRGDLDRIVHEAITEASRVLRPHTMAYVTNGDGWELGERAIIEYVVSHAYGWNIQYGREASVNAIDNAFHLLDGKGVAKHPHTLVCAIRSAMTAGLKTCETPYFRVKWFKNGNLHFEFLRMDLVAELNARTADHRSLRDVFRKPNPKARHRQRQRKTYADLNFFPTPQPVAEKLIQLAQLDSLPYRARILEPSAGEGAILSALKGKYLNNARVSAVEIDPARAATIRQLFPDYAVVEMDFLDFTPAEPFTRIIANPPFSDGRDAGHILHMLSLLAPGGVLASVASGGVMFRSDRVYVDLREAVERFGGTIEPLPEQSFEESGTNANTCIVFVRKPEK